MKNDIHDLGLVLDSRVKLILIESWDEPKVMETLTGLAVRRGLGLYAWSVTEGVQRLGFGGEPLGGEESRDPVAALRLIKHDQQANLYVLCDLHPFLGDSPTLVRLLKEIAMAEGNHRPTVVLVSHALKLRPKCSASPRGSRCPCPARTNCSASSARKRRAGASATVVPACAPTTAPCSRW